MGPQHGLEGVERRTRKKFFVPHWGKLTKSGLHNPAQAHTYGGCHPGAALTPPETTRRYPGEADTVVEETQTPKGLFRTGKAALSVQASSHAVELTPPPPPPYSLPYP